MLEELELRIHRKEDASSTEPRHQADRLREFTRIPLPARSANFVLIFWHFSAACETKRFFSPLLPVGSHRVLQAAAQSGAQFYFVFAVLRTLFSCGRVSLFHLKTCTPMKATP